VKEPEITRGPGLGPSPEDSSGRVGATDPADTSGPAPGKNDPGKPRLKGNSPRPLGMLFGEETTPQFNWVGDPSHGKIVFSAHTSG